MSVCRNKTIKTKKHKCLLKPGGLSPSLGCRGRAGGFCPCIRTWELPRSKVQGAGRKGRPGAFGGVCTARALTQGGPQQDFPGAGARNGDGPGPDEFPPLPSCPGRQHGPFGTARNSRQPLSLCSGPSLPPNAGCVLAFEQDLTLRVPSRGAGRGVELSTSVRAWLSRGLAQCPQGQGRRLPVGP